MRPTSPFNPKSYLASGEKWRDRIARLAFPILLERAIQRRSISYSGLAEEIERRFDEPAKRRKTLYGHPIGKIGEALEELGQQRGEEIPPLSALVVDKNTHLPGKGGFAFIRRYFVNSEKSVDEKSIDPEFILKLVCDSHDWNLIAKYFGVVLPKPTDRITDEEPIHLPRDYRVLHT